jgi:hypothetical protein
MSNFRWTKQKSDAALGLAVGKPNTEVAGEVGVNEITIRRWRCEPEFSQEVDRLTLMVDIASRAERLRIAMRVVRERTKGESVETDKDLLDWLKFAQGETDGIKLDLTSLLEANSLMAGPDGPSSRTTRKNRTG